MAGAFSPITGKMEPLALDEQSRYLFDALSHCFVEPGVSVPAKTGGGTENGARRQVFWTVGNAAEKNDGQYQELEFEDDVIDGEGEGDDVSRGLDAKRARLERALAASEGGVSEGNEEGGVSEENKGLLMGGPALLEEDGFEEGDEELDWEEGDESEYEEGDEFEEGEQVIPESQVEDDVMGREPGLVFFEVRETWATCSAFAALGLIECF
jgi:hypothetical protein